MKTFEDLINLLPVIKKELLSKEHIISETGNTDPTSYSSNFYCYYEDGWQIEIYYDCFGEWSDDSGDYWTAPASDLVRASGSVAEIYIYHLDESNEDETEFDEEAHEYFKSEINKILEEIL